MTLGAVMVPLGLAFGTLAGLPMAGLYASLFPLIVFALFCSSRQLVLGPDATMATFVAVSVAPLAGGDPVRLASLAGLLAIFIGVICVGAGLLRLGFMADFLAKPVIIGFMNGLAVVVVAGQLKNIFGFDAGGDTTLDKIVAAFRNLEQTNWPTFFLAAACVVIILAMGRWTPHIPGPVVVLILSIVAAAVFGLTAYGVTLVGEIPSGLPSLQIPSFSISDVGTMIPLAFAATLLVFSDTVAIGRGFAARNHYQIDANKEIIALGLSNAASALTQGMPVGGSGSRTAIVDSMRSYTQLAGVVAAITVAVVLLFLTPLISWLPNAALGGILVAAAYGLCDIAGFRALLKFRTWGFVIALTVFVGVVAIGLMEGILIGVGFSLVLLVYAVTFPHDCVIGKADDGFFDMAFRPDARAIPGFAIYRFPGPLFFANSGRFRSRVEELTQNTEVPVHTFVLDASMIIGTDFTACETLIDVNEELGKRGIRFTLAQVRANVRETFERGGVIESLGEVSIFHSIEEAIDTTGSDRSNRRRKHDR